MAKSTYQNGMHVHPTHQNFSLKSVNEGRRNPISKHYPETHLLIPLNYPTPLPNPLDPSTCPFSTNHATSPYHTTNPPALDSSRTGSHTLSITFFTCPHVTPLLPRHHPHHPSKDKNTPHRTQSSNKTNNIIVNSLFTVQRSFSSFSRQNTWQFC